MSLTLFLALVAISWIISLSLVVYSQNARLHSLAQTVLPLKVDVDDNDIRLSARMDKLSLNSSSRRGDLVKRIEAFEQSIPANNFELDKRMVNLEQDRDVADTERLELEEMVQELGGRVNFLEDAPSVEISSIEISPITVRDYVEAALALKTLNEEDLS